MGFAIVYGLAGIVAVIWHGLTWRLRVGSRRITILLFLALSLAASFCSAVLLLVHSYIVEGYLIEPVRLTGILFVLTLPVSLITGLPFLALGPRRYPAGCCQKCGYDLTGNESGRCPECAHPLTREAHHADARA